MNPYHRPYQGLGNRFLRSAESERRAATTDFANRMTADNGAASQIQGFVESHIRLQIASSIEADPRTSIFHGGGANVNPRTQGRRQPPTPAESLALLTSSDETGPAVDGGSARHISNTDRAGSSFSNETRVAPLIRRIQLLNQFLFTHATGASPEVINANSVTYEYRNLGGDGEKEQCAICWTEYAEKDAVRRLTCMHLYHKECVDKWLTNKKTCPICRRNILKRKPADDPPLLGPAPSGMNVRTDASSGSGSGSSQLTIILPHPPASAPPEAADPAPRRRRVRRTMTGGRVRLFGVSDNRPPGPPRTSSSFLRAATNPQATSTGDFIEIATSDAAGH